LTVVSVSSVAVSDTAADLPISILSVSVRPCAKTKAEQKQEKNRAIDFMTIATL
jgi:hypothetical protein